MTIASQFINIYGNRPLEDDEGIAAQEWAYTRDPDGKGELDKPNLCVHITFTDGSRAKLDLSTATYSQVN